MSAYPPGSEPRRLAELEESRGLLVSVSCADGCALAQFEWGAVSLPPELEPMLAGLVGQEIAILRLDGRYHARVA